MVDKELLSVDGQILNELISGRFKNPVGNYGIIELIKKHLKDGNKAVIYDNISRQITHYLELDDNLNFKFPPFKKK